MSIGVIPNKEGEKFISLLKRFKMQCNKEHIFQSMQKNTFFEKPSDIRRRKKKMKKIAISKYKNEQRQHSKKGRKKQKSSTSKI